MSKFMDMSAEEKKRIAKERFAELDKEFRARKPLFVKHYTLVPKSCKRLFLEVLLGKSTVKSRIKLKCLECFGYQRDEIKHCNDESCALWAVRPYQGK